MHYNKTSVKPAKGPVVSVRKGRFQVSVWSRPGYREAPELQLTPLQQGGDYRACVQFSIYDDRYRRWDAQQIWCNARELEGLKYALAELGGEEE